MVTQKFGSLHTEKKLVTVEKYLSAFTTALKKQRFDLYYFDACAGSGSSIPKSETKQDDLIDFREITVGSAVRALSVQPAFDHYILNDVKERNVQSLGRIVGEQFPRLSDRVRIWKEDANEALTRFCTSVDWKKSRAVVFLDPFGLQIKFSTLKKLAATQAVDVWYLVPVHAMSRQVRKDGKILEDGGLSVDAALGTDEWRHIVAVDEEPTLDLFGVASGGTKKAANARSFELFVQQRLASIFEGGVVQETLPLGRNGAHHYSLMFAWANPGEPAKLAAKLARAVLK